MKYQKEIDGLRAVAVLPVVLFHAGFSLFAGGYVGVDIFFVISGYLITSLILAEEETGKFSIVGFYERRARRILPALFAVMIVSLPFAWFWMAPAELKNFGEGIAAVALFSSNILFFLHSGYFSPDAGLNPLLHTWSLAVEEQYYVFFPLLAVLCWRLGRVFFFSCIAAIGLLSFAFAHLGGSFKANFPFIDSDWTFMASNFGFYLTPARAWELMAGALLAANPQVAQNLAGSLRNIGAALGLAAILFSIFVFGKNTPFPSYYTLLPVLGTVLVIMCAGTTTLVGRALSCRPVVGMGLISYSVYLWHQPLLAFYRIHNAVPPTTVVAWELALLSVLLGYLSWRYVEQPFRDRNRITRGQIFAFSGIGSLIFIALGYFLYASNGAVMRFPEKDRYLLGFDVVQEDVYVPKRFMGLDRDFTNTAQKKMLVIGDSYAEDFVNMMAENNALRSYEVSTYYVPQDCQIILPVIDMAYCRKTTIASDTARKRIARADVIVLSASWSPQAAAALQTTLSKAGINKKRFFIVGAKGFGEIRPLLYLNLSHSGRAALRNSVPSFEANAIIGRKFRADKFIDIEKIICGPTLHCPLFTPDDRLISFDGFHFTPDGARFAGQKLLTQTPLGTLR